MADDLIIDIFSGFDHKAGMGGSSGPDQAPKFLSDEDKRRINFYARVRAYIETVGRYFLNEDDDDPDREENWREFGDPAVLVERQAAAVVGDGVIVSVVGADEAIPDQPDIASAPKDPADLELPDVEAAIAQEIFEDSIAVWEINARAELDRWRNQIAAMPALVARQDWLREWANRSEFIPAVFENETENVVPLGSGIYVLGWNDERGIVDVEIYEPDVYFPVLDDSATSSFPDKVHLAWIYTETEGEEETEYVRKITYELRPLAGSEEAIDAEEVATETGDALRYLGEGETQTKTCLLTDATWKLDEFEKLDDVSAGGTFRTILVDGSEVELDEYPIGLDFVPVVHVPNTLARSTHFGRSALARISQIFDEVAATDADEALASRWAARPPVGISGMSPGESSIDMTPGKGIRLGDNGRVSTINMAENLAQIGERLSRLLKRLSVNAQVPEGLLGRVDASEVPSGLALTLSFTPFEQLIDRSRMARAGKYSLLLKMVQRIAIQNEDPTLEIEGLDGLGETGTAYATSVYPSELRFGSFMPQDLAGIANTIALLVQSSMISQETGIRMLQEAGVPSSDLGVELAAIRAVMVTEADALTGALEDPRYAAEFLGIDDYEARNNGVDPEGGNVIVPAGGAVDAGPAVEG